MWKQQNGLDYKEMKYQNSCYPCSLQIILANLGYAGKDESIEDLWDRLHRRYDSNGLNHSAPNEQQVHEYLAATPQWGNRGVVYSPTFMQGETMPQIAERIIRDFIKKKGPVGMIAGIGHATVFFKKADGRILHLNPSPDVQYIAITEIADLSIDGRLDPASGEWAICFKSANEPVISAHHIMIIS